MITRPAILALLALALQALGAAEAAARGTGEVPFHGDATLESPTTSVVAGELLTLNGSSFVPGQKHRLVLRGVLDEYVLGAVTAAADSTFAVEMRVPGEAGGGQFRVVAVAPDGDDVATLDLALTAAPVARTEAAPAGQAGAGMDTPAEPTAAGGGARTEELVIQRSRAGFEWSVIGLVVGLAGGLGVGLLRRP